MLYLEDYLEMIEHLPQELRDRFTEIRELDLSVQNNTDILEKRVRSLFGNCRRGEITTDMANQEFADIRKEFCNTLDDVDEKVHIANQMYELVERYLRKLDTELYKFKCELEADNKGITEVLEKRSLEMDQPTSLTQTPQSSHHKDNRYRARAEKRRESWGGSNNSLGGLSSGTRNSDMAGVGSVTGGGRGGEARALVAATAPLALSRTDSAIQAALGRGVTDNSSPGSYTLGNMGAGNALAAAASQAIAATQQMQQGRRTASLKASYEAINAGVPGGAPGELQLGRELAGAAQQALQAAHHHSEQPLLLAPQSGQSLHHLGHHQSTSQGSSSNKRHKKKSSYGSSSSNSGLMLHAQQTLTGSASRSSSPTQSVGNVGVSNAAPITSMPLAEDALTDSEWTCDPNEPRYCVCNQVSYGDMVACDNEECRFEWFHYPCVGITAPPKGKWYCPQCSTNMRRNRGSRKN